MNILDDFLCVDIAYRKSAAGWVDDIYYPREEEMNSQVTFTEKVDGVYKIHSRVFKETEETGFGVYCYEETTHFRTKFPGSNYTVEVLFVNPSQHEYKCHIRLNRVLMNECVTVRPGEEKRVSFTACMTDGSFSLSFPVGDMCEITEEVLEGDVYVKDITIVMQKEKTKREKPHLFLASDSTVQSYEKEYYPQGGWGQFLWRFFEGMETCKEYPCTNCDYQLARTYELEQLVIENRAIGGRSIRSFYEEGKWNQILEALCPGDFVFIQFGHNDNTPARPNRYTPPELFYEYLKQYLEACVRRGTQCVFVTPVAMRVFDENGRFKLSFEKYREQMQRLAKEQNVPVLDLGQRSVEYLNEIGEEESKKIYLWLEKGEYPEGAYAEGVYDKTHLQEYGATVYANMVAWLISENQAEDTLDVLKKIVKPIKYGKI